MDVLKGAISASIAALVWGFVFWWSPLPYMAITPIDKAEEISVTLSLRAQLAESGVYMIPGPSDPLSMLRELRGTGSVMTFYVLANEDILPWWETLLTGFFRVFAATALAGWLLKKALPALPSTYMRRVGFVALLAITVIIYRDLADPIWWYYPWEWNTVKAFHDLVAWTFSSFILAFFIKN